MNRALLPLLVAFGVLAIAVAGWWLKRPADALSVACPDPVVGCHFIHGGIPAHVQFSAVPVPLEGFELALRAPGVRHAHAEFQMVGMDMGFNRYDLRPQQAGFQARITLPVCVSGRRDWMLYLELDGTRYAMPFSSR